MARSEAHWTPEYLEEAIYRTRTSLSSSSHRESFPEIVLNPEVAAKDRFRYFGSIEGVEEPSGPFVSRSGSRSVPETSESDQTLDEMKSLYLVINDGDTVKIDEAIKKGRSITTSASSSEPPVLDRFCDILSEAFDRTKKIEYLNESISIRRQLIETPRPHVQRLRTLPPFPILAHPLPLLSRLPHTRSRRRG